MINRLIVKFNRWLIGNKRDIHASEPVKLKGMIATFHDGDWITTSAFYPGRTKGDPMWERKGWHWQEVELEVRIKIATYDIGWKDHDPE